MLKRSTVRAALVAFSVVAVWQFFNLAPLRADISQDIGADASVLDLAAAGYGTLNGAGINTGVVEFGGFANAQYLNGAGIPIANPVPGGTTMALPNGNPDLPATAFNFVQLANNNLTTDPLPQPIGNHASVVSGVIVGTGNTAGLDTGIATSAPVRFAAFSGSQTNASNAIAQVLQQAGTPLANNSWGYGYSVAPAVAPNAYLNAASYLQAVDGGGNPLYLNIAMTGTTTVVANAATYTAGAQAGRPIPIVQLQAATQNPVATNNGSSLVSRYADWQAQTSDKLVVIAGNEAIGSAGTPTLLSATTGYFPKLPVGNIGGAGAAPSLNLEAGAPSDNYNSINVASTGQRGQFAGNAFAANPGNDLYYGVASQYNTSNITGGAAIGIGTGATTGISPITGYGRLKTDIVAPGGDPGSNSTALVGTAGTPASYGTPGGLRFDDQFESTAGGVTSGGAGDTFNGNNVGAPAVPFNDVTSNSNYFTSGANITPYGSFGTSYAAPLVTGAGSLIYQYGVANFGALGTASTYHNVIKAIILNGAAHTFDGNALEEANGTTPWTRVAGKGSTPVPAGTTLAQFPAGLTVRPGLDPQLGTGILDVVGSLNNYAAGRQTPGLVNPTGWDTQTVGTGVAPNSIVDRYTINVPVYGLFKATLAWDDFVAATNTGVGAATVTGASTFTRANLTDLDLYLFSSSADGTVLGNAIDYSTSDIDNVEYLYDILPVGTYQLDVVDAQYAPPQATPYGLAWTTTAVPEPMAMSIIALAPLVLKRRRNLAGRQWR